MISFTVQYCFLFRFVCTELCFTDLSSSNLNCNLCLWYYEQLVQFDKEINANVYRHSLWKYYERFHCSFEWHLTPHLTLSIETCIRRTRCIKRTLQHFPRTVSVYYRFHCTDQRLDFEIPIVYYPLKTLEPYEMNRRDAI